jgi:hypothetical protein
VAATAATVALLPRTAVEAEHDDRTTGEERSAVGSFDVVW